MKILLTLFEIQDYGGIVADVEYLAKGLMENGHEVNLVLLRPNQSSPSIRKMTGPRGSYPSIFGGEVNTLAGWYGVTVMGYAGEQNILSWKKLANQYDLVIHEIPNPKDDDGGWWQQIYDIDPPQIIAAHDAHFRDMYPYIADVAERITAITCTNHAGYVALEWCPIPRAFIGAAHELENWDRKMKWGQRVARAVCAHVWKAWKHNDIVVRAIPHLQHSGILMAGDGIEGRYMRSKDKCKPKYKGIWEAAFSEQTGNGRGAYLGLLTGNQLYQLYTESRVMVDMSYSKKFAALGNHFNRSILEAANNGCISICTIENMRENNPQVELFQDGITHVGVHQGIDPKDLAAVVDWACNLREEDAMPMVEAARKVLSDHFDYRKTCLQYLELAKGNPAGIYPLLETGKLP